LFAATDTGFELPANTMPTLDDLQQYVRFNYKTLWVYRFAYRELAALLRSDPELRTNFLAYRKRGFEGFDQLFDAFVSSGVLIAPTKPEVRANLAETIWLISEFWLNSLEIAGKPVNETQMERGVQLMMQVLNPFINRLSVVHEKA
jgi:hypothetical protein